MTLKEFAKIHGITVQAVYKKLKAKGIDVESLSDKDSRQLTTEGINQLVQLYPEPVVSTTDQPSNNEELQKKNETIIKLEAEVETLKFKLSECTARIAELQADKERLSKSLDQAQQLQAITLAKIPESRPSFLKRLFSGRKKDMVD